MATATDITNVQAVSAVPGTQAQEPAIQLQPIDPGEQSILKSRLDNLDRWQTAKLFRRVWTYAFMMATLNTIDGWQVSTILCGRRMV